MEYFRVYQHLTRGMNIKHLDRDLELVKDRFDGNLFDILAVKERTWVGILLSEDSDETQHRLEQSGPWRERFEAEVYVVTERPQDFAGVDRVISYAYDRGHHFNRDSIRKFIEAGIPDLVLEYVTDRLQPREKRFARELCKRILRENT